MNQSKYVREQLSAGKNRREGFDKTPLWIKLSSPIGIGVLSALLGCLFLWVFFTTESLSEFLWKILKAI